MANNEMSHSELQASVDVHLRNDKEYRELYDNIPISYQSLDSNGCFLNVNSSWLKLLGYERREVIGKSFSDFLHPDDKPAFGKKFPELKQEGCVSEVGFRIRHKNGNYLDISLTGNVLRWPDGRFRETFCVFYDITDQIQTQLALKKSQNELQSIFRVTPTGIGVVKDRVFTKINDKFCEITGYSREELLGKNSRFLYPSDKDFEYVGTEKYRQIDTGGSGTVETRFKRKDGKIIDILMSSTPIDAKDLSIGVTFTALDITKRKNAERAMRESEEKYRSIMDSMDDAAYICSPDFRIEFMNPAMTRMVGYNAVGEKCYATIFGFDKKCRNCFYDEVKQGNIIKKEIQNKKENKTYYTSNSPVRHPDGSTSMLTVFRDITEIRQMETRIQQAQKMEAIGTLAGGIAHDFNNILFPITGHAEILLTDVPEDSLLRDSINEIYAGAKRATELVKQILTFSRQESTELKIIKIQHIVREALKLIRSAIPTTIEIRQNIDNTCGTVKADPTQIHQIVMNLSTNASHAMEETGGILNVTLKEIEFEAVEDANFKMKPGRYICLTIGDSGVGIPNDVVEKIFDPFFTTKKRGKGTGMGLSVVHGIVTGMGGDIKVYSRHGKGTEFRVYFPTEKKSFEEGEIKSKIPIPGGNECILLVDDEQSIIELEKQVLERLGYKVISRTSSIEALETFRSAPKNYDLVISDVAMPKLSGDKLASKMIDIRADIPILLCTGFSETITPEKAEEMGVRGFLMKPLIIKDLARTIRKVLDT